MAIGTIILIWFTLLARCSRGTSYSTNSAIKSTTHSRVSGHGSEQMEGFTKIYPVFKSDNIINQLEYRSKRNVRTRQQTSHLTLSSHELMYKIFSPNYKWEELYDLQFDNSNSSLCQGDLEIITDCQVILPRLSRLTLNNFTNCETLFDNILSCLEISQLSSLKLNGQINDDFIQQFHELLRKNYGSLNEISLSGLLQTRFNIFEIRANYTFKNLSAIFMRPRLDQVIVAKNIVNNRFCSIFPNLVKLGIKQTMIDLDQVLRLQRCRKLKYLKVVIHLSINDHTRLLQVDWKSLFPVLENIALKLVFDKCPSPSTFEQLTNRMSDFRKYIFCSNCNLAVHRNIKCTQGSQAKY